MLLCPHSAGARIPNIDENSSNIFNNFSNFPLVFTFSTAWSESKYPDNLITHSLNILMAIKTASDVIVPKTEDPIHLCQKGAGRQTDKSDQYLITDNQQKYYVYYY